MTERRFSIVVSTGVLSEDDQYRVFCSVLSFLASRFASILLSSWCFGYRMGQPIADASVTLDGAADMIRDARKQGLIDRGSTDLWVTSEHFRAHFCNDFDIHFETDDERLADEMEGFLRGAVPQVFRQIR